MAIAVASDWTVVIRTRTVAEVPVVAFNRSAFRRKAGIEHAAATAVAAFVSELKSTIGRSGFDLDQRIQQRADAVGSQFVDERTGLTDDDFGKLCRGGIRILRQQKGCSTRHMRRRHRRAGHRERIAVARSEEHTSELQSLRRISYAVFCLKKKKKNGPNRMTKDDARHEQSEG